MLNRELFIFVGSNIDRFCLIEWEIILLDDH